MMLFRALCAFLLVSVFGGASGQFHKRALHPSPYRSSVATGQLVVVLEPGVDVTMFAMSQGLEMIRPFESLPNAFVMRAGTVEEAKGFKATYGARAVYQDRLIRHTRHAFTPNDPLFPPDSPEEGWPGQWYLKNSDPNGYDIRVEGPWSRDVTGSGIQVGIVDDGFEITHPDFAGVLSSNGFDFGQSDSNPSPVYDDDIHGTAVAGIVAARGGNGIGITGAAPFAQIACLRTDFLYGTASSFADATLYRSSGANTSIKIKVHAYGVSDTFVSQTLERDALITSTSAGTIHIFSAGNERGNMAEDCAKQMLQGNPAAIVVAGMGSDGTYSDYSSFGGSVMCTAPSAATSLLPIVTTDRSGEAFGYNGDDDFPNAAYTSAMTGTSASAPLVAGIAAMAKQIQPNLNTRFFKHLLVRTSRLVDGTHPEWTTNQAGNQFNPNFGFGLVDADALTLALNDFASVSSQAIENEPFTSVAEDLPDSDPNGLTKTFTIISTTPLEEVLVTLNVSHPFCGDLEAYITSPRGTTAKLFSKADDPGIDLNWTFCSNAFWGENPSGVWTLKLVDTTEFDVGVWNSFSATMRMGTLVGTDRVDSLSLSPSTVFGGSSTTGRVYLFGPARAGGATVTLSSSSSTASVPSSVTVPAGATNAPFAISTSIVPDQRNVTISATRLGLTKTAVLTVKPPIASGLTFAPSAVLGGSTAVGTVSLSSVAPTGGLIVALSSPNPAAVVPATVTIPAGQASAQFDITTVGVHINQNCAITATVGDIDKTAILVVNRAILASLTLAQSNLTGGISTTATISLNGPAPMAGANVLFTSTNPVVIVPARVTIPGSQVSKTFTVRTAPVATTTNVGITATRAGQTKTAVLVVTKPLLVAITLNKPSVAGGQSVVATVTLSGPAPDGGILVDLADTSDETTVPPTVLVFSGQTSANVTVNTSPVASPTSSIIRATLNSIVKGVTLSIYPTTLEGFTLSPKPITGGNTLSFTIILSSPATTGGTSVSLSSTHPGIIAVPSSVLIPQGTLSKTFTVVTSRPSAETSVTIRASKYGTVLSDIVLVKR